MIQQSSDIYRFVAHDAQGLLQLAHCCNDLHLLCEGRTRLSGKWTTSFAWNGRCERERRNVGHTPLTKMQFALIVERLYHLVVELFGQKCLQ